jgi:hypothetical protein
MKLTLRSFLVLVIGIAVAFVLYIATDLSLDPSAGPFSMNPNFSAVVSAWRALGGVAGEIEIGGEGGMPPFAGGGEGGAPFGGRRGGRHGTGFGEGINVERALGQMGSDLLWIGVPALLGVIVELLWWHTRKRKPREAPSTSSAGGTE